MSKYKDRGDNPSTCRSVVRLHGSYSSRCGYCEKRELQTESNSVSYGMQAFQLTCKDYEGLINRGWRRSGTYLYKPTMCQTCCPQYTIRLDVNNFKISKSQRRVRNRLNRFLNGEQKVLNVPNSEQKKRHGADKSVQQQGENGEKQDIQQLVWSTIQEILSSRGTGLAEVVREWSVSNVQVKPFKAANSGDCEWTCPVAFKLAAMLRRSAIEDEYANMEPKTLAQLLARSVRPNKWKVEVGGGGFLSFCRLVKDDANGSELSKVDGRDKIDVEGDATLTAPKKRRALRTHKRPRQPTPPLVPETNGEGNAHHLQFIGERSSPLSKGGKRVLKIETVPSAYREDEYELYRTYQMAVHGDTPEKLQRDDYERFLVDSPLIVERDESGRIVRGSFHQRYLLDGKLIAVGVCDILPVCLSSVYFFYDPELGELQLGKYSALREIEFVKEVAQRDDRFHYYYMGFYIASCRKMRYKGAYTPSELLCPETYRWVLLSECSDAIDELGYVRLYKEGHSSESREPENDMDEAEIEESIARVPLQLGSRPIITLGKLVTSAKQILRPILTEYVVRVGGDLAKSIVVTLG